MLFVRESSFYRSFFSLAGLITLQNLVIFSVNLADNVMLGMYSETALSGANLALQIQFILQLLIIGIADGLVVIISRYWGMAQTAPIKHVANIGMKFGLLLCLILWIAAYFYSYGLLSLFTNEEAIILAGVEYMRIACFTYFTFTVTNVLLATLRGVETVKIGFMVAVMTLVINVFLNWALIYGNLGAPEMGIKGAAYATVIARSLEMLAVIAYVKFWDKKLQLRFKDYLLNPPWQTAKTFIRIALPVVGGEALWGLGAAAQTAILGHIGAAAIAAASITGAVFQIVSVGIHGAISASVVVLGKTLGMGGIDKFKQYAKTLQVIYVLIGLVTGLAVFMLKGFIVDFYAISPEAYKLTMQFLTVLSITIIFTSYEYSSMAGIIRGGGDTRFMFYNDFIFMWLVVVPSGYLAAFVLGWPPVWVFFCLRYDQIVKCLVAFVKVNRFRFIKQF